MTVARRPGTGRTAASTDAPLTTRELVLVVDDDDQMLRLVKRVLERARIPATVRLTRGRDIEAACGQLAASRS